MFQSEWHNIISEKNQPTFEQTLFQTLIFHSSQNMDQSDRGPRKVTKIWDSLKNDKSASKFDVDVYLTKNCCSLLLRGLPWFWQDTTTVCRLRKFWLHQNDSNQYFFLLWLSIRHTNDLTIKSWARHQQWHRFHIVFGWDLNPRSDHEPSLKPQHRTYLLWSIMFIF